MLDKKIEQRNSLMFEKSGFTLAEIMVVLLVVSIVTLATIGIFKSRSKYGQRFMAYASLKNLMTISSSLVTTGSSSVAETGVAPTSGPGSPVTKTGYYDNTACKAVVDAYATMLDAEASDQNCRAEQSAFPDDPHTADCSSYSSNLSDANDGYDAAKAASKILNTDDGNYYTMIGVRCPTVEYTCGTGSPINCYTIPISGVDWTQNCSYSYTYTPSGNATCANAAYPTMLQDSGTGTYGCCPSSSTSYTSASNSCSKPIASSSVLPTMGHATDGSKTGFCDKTIDMLNTLGTGAECTHTVTSAGPFNDAVLNFATTNSARYFNFGANPNFDNGAKTSDVDGNAMDDYFNVFVDISGSKGKSTLNDDVLEFWIFRDGLVIPAPTSIAWTNTDYLKESVKYRSGTKWLWLTNFNNVAYKNAFCTATSTANITTRGLTAACSGVASSTTECGADGHMCQLVPTKPGF